MKFILWFILGLAAGLYIKHDLNTPVAFLYLGASLVGNAVLRRLIGPTTDAAVADFWKHAQDYGRRGVHWPLDPRKCAACPPSIKKAPQ